MLHAKNIRKTPPSLQMFIMCLFYAQQIRQVDIRKRVVVRTEQLMLRLIIYILLPSTNLSSISFCF
jgi:hypothetical protein